MSTRILTICAAFLLLLSSCETRQHPRAAIALFNGKDLSGWESWLVDTKHDDPRRVFSVTNGAIRISGDGLGYLASTNEFRDYHLIVEFKWGSQNTRWGNRMGKARDSGVFLHATGPHGNSEDGGGAFMAAIECNIFQGATGDVLLIRGTNFDGALIRPRVSFRGSAGRDADGFRWFDPSGGQHQLERWGRVNWRNKSCEWRDEIGFRGPRDAEKPGEWNRLDIICEGGRIRVLLNDVVVNEVFHHIADYNWNPDAGCPSFVTEPCGNSVIEDERAAKEVRRYAGNIADWLGTAV